MLELTNPKLRTRIMIKDTSRMRARAERTPTNPGEPREKSKNDGGGDADGELLVMK